MIVEFERGGKRFAANLSDGCSIAISLDFDGPQPNHFGVEPASRRPLEVGDFIGRTSSGSGCNVDSIQLVPHCNGTHTETIGHIVNESVDIANAALRTLLAGSLVSIDPVRAVDCGESYRPEFEKADRVITKTSIDKALDQTNWLDFEALIIRTLPNQDNKRSRVYDETSPPPFLTIEAIDRVNKSGIRHLIVDIPSIDRMHDNGLLTNHHLFWNVPERTHTQMENSWTDKTITEMVFVPDRLKDGQYLVNLQCAPFCCDAAPSRPILIPLLEA